MSTLRASAPWLRMALISFLPPRISRTCVTSSSVRAATSRSVEMGEKRPPSFTATELADGRAAETAATAMASLDIVGIPDSAS